MGHNSTKCDRPARERGDIFPLPSRSNNYVVEIKDKASPSRPPIDDKGKGNMVNVITMEQVKQKEADVLPLGKRLPEEREGRSAAGSSKKKEKMKEGDDAKVRKKRAP